MAKAAQSTQPASTRNTVDPEKYAEALAIYEQDKGLRDRASGQLRRHQMFYETEFGINAAGIRERYKESQMTEKERTKKYEGELIGRRALNLWNAEKPEDFEALIEAASAVEPASGDGYDKLSGQRAYDDGFNSAAHGGQVEKDNKHRAGTLEHQQWTRGCKDGLDYKKTFSNGREAPPKRPVGRPRKTPLESLQENAEKFGANGHSANEGEGSGEEEGPGLFPDTSGERLPV